MARIWRRGPTGFVELRRLGCFTGSCESNGRHDTSADGRFGADGVAAIGSGMPKTAGEGRGDGGAQRIYRAALVRSASSSRLRK